MGLFNAGRAYWITTQYRPANEADIPERTSLADRILVIPTDAPPDAATQDALETYWEAVLRAAGDQIGNRRRACRVDGRDGRRC